MDTNLKNETHLSDQLPRRFENWLEFYKYYTKNAPVGVRGRTIFTYIDSENCRYSFPLETIKANAFDYIISKLPDSLQIFKLQEIALGSASLPMNNPDWVNIRQTITSLLDICRNNDL